MSTDVRISSGLCLWLMVAGAAPPVAAQNSADALQLAELTSLKGKVGSADTRRTSAPSPRRWTSPSRI